MSSRHNFFGTADPGAPDPLGDHEADGTAHPHDHDGDYSVLGHNHDADYSAVGHTHAHGGTTIEAGQVNASGEVEFRWGIDGSGRPYFDSTGAVANGEAARLYLDVNEGRFKAEDLGGI